MRLGHVEKLRFGVSLHNHKALTFSGVHLVKTSSGVVSKPLHTGAHQRLSSHPAGYPFRPSNEHDEDILARSLIEMTHFAKYQGILASYHRGSKHFLTGTRYQLVPEPATVELTKSQSRSDPDI